MSIFIHDSQVKVARAISCWASKVLSDCGLKDRTNDPDTLEQWHWDAGMNQKQYRVNSLANFSLSFLLLLCVWLAPSFSRFHNCFRTLWIRSWIQRWGVIIGFAANMLSCVALTVQSCPQGYTHCALYTGSMHLEKGIYTRTLYRMYICVCVCVWRFEGG